MKGILTGLDRRKDPVAAVGALYTQAWEILRHLRSWSLAQIARAATSKAFLTKPGGVHYGASVLCADGVIYSAGQYASYNHSTNVHAEQGALVLATMAGRPDVLALALATSEPGAFARPCGVCRQIMLEHAMRIGHDFDVVMSSSSGILDIRTVTGLLPLAWPSHHASVVGSGDPCQGRAMIPTLDTSHRRWPVAVGDIVCHGDGNLLSLVWDPCLSKGLALVKIKYRREKGVWVKMPHSLTEPFQYERSLRDLGRSCPTGFGGFAAVVHSAEITGIGSSPTTLDILPPEFYRLLGEALIQPGSVRMTGSRAVGLSTEGSDHDVVISASPAQIRRFRAIALEGYRQGLLGVPIASGSWKWLGASFPGGQNEILRQGRFIETFEMGANRFAILFVPPDPQPMVVDETWRLDGRGAIHGIVIEADDAPYKRSVFQVRCPDGLMVEAIVFFKLGNLVFPGDHLALHGWMLTSLNRQSTRRLVLLSPSSDKIVWLETAPPSCGGGSLSLIRNGSK